MSLSIIFYSKEHVVIDAFELRDEVFAAFMGNRNQEDRRLNLALGLRLSFLFALFSFSVDAQYLYLPVTHEYRILAERITLSEPEKHIHSSIQPFARGEFGAPMKDSLFFAEPKKTSKKNSFWSWVDRKLYNEHFASLQGEGFEVNLNPWINFEMGIDPQIQDRSSITYLSTRGLWIEGRIGKQFSFFTGLAENLGAFPDGLTTYYNQTGYVMGRGNYNNARGESNIDFPLAVGGVSYQPSKYFNISFAHGKQFIGIGYRSMMLSDYALPYPSLKIETKLGSVNYTNIWAVHTDPRPEVQLPGGVYRKKYTSIHYLSWNINERLNIALYESMVWGGDTSNPNGGFDVNFLNPVIFFRPVEKLVGVRGGNAMIGLSSSYLLADGLKVYGQFVLDDFQFAALKELGKGHWLNMYGWQLGLKYYTKPSEGSHLFARLEYNGARPFIYAHRWATTNYTHLMQPLAHPWGANFQEFVLMGQYQAGRWLLETQLNFGFRGRDTSDANFGNDLFRSIFDREGDLGFNMGGARREYVFYGHLQLAYILNSLMGTRIEAGVRIRNTYNEGLPMLDQRSTWFFAGFRMPIFNRYFDI